MKTFWPKTQKTNKAESQKQSSAKNDWFSHDDRGTAWLKDQAVLAVIAMSDGDPVLRQIAVDQLEDEDILIHVAQNDGDKYVRLTAIEKIDDQSVLMELAETEEQNDIRQAVMARLSTTAVPQKEEVYRYSEKDEEFQKDEEAIY